MFVGYDFLGCLLLEKWDYIYVALLFCFLIQKYLMKLFLS